MLWSFCIIRISIFPVFNFLFKIKCPSLKYGVQDSRSNWLVTPPTLMGATPQVPHAQYKSVQSQLNRVSFLQLQHMTPMQPLRVKIYIDNLFFQLIKFKFYFKKGMLYPWPTGCVGSWRVETNVLLLLYHSVGKKVFDWVIDLAVEQPQLFRKNYTKTNKSPLRHFFLSM